jgi:hypothetical protein
MSPYPYLSGSSEVSGAGATALAAGLKDSSLSELNLCTLSALPLNLVLFTSAPLVLYSNFVPRMYSLSLSDCNKLTQADKDTVTRAWEAAGKKSGGLFV